MQKVTIIGGGLAGCEAALWLAQRGVPVRLIEQKPLAYSPAHQRKELAELVCSNSFKAEREDSAGGLLKNEMRLLGSHLLQVAEECRVPAGGALAVNRENFAAGVTRLVESRPEIQLEHRQVGSLAGLEGIVLIASGPLTSGGLGEELGRLAGEGQLYFYDAAAPIVTADSLDMDKVFAAARYDRGEADYLNCPFDKAGYEAFHAELLAAQTAPLHEFDKNLTVYEGCMPVEVMAKRGADTLRYGPMRPVGLRDPRTGHRPWANVQLRKENKEGTLYNLVGFQTNLKFPEQKRVFSMIPGLENAEFARFGVMHRNTFLNSPLLLSPSLQLKTRPELYFAGQITGFEGYMESAACGLLAAHSVFAALRGNGFAPPPVTTMNGALLQYITTENKDFQPMGANMGLLPPWPELIKDKRLRYGALAQRAMQAMQAWVRQYNEENRL